MAARRYRIGVLFSDSGPYGTVSRALRNGALLAFEELRQQGSAGVDLEPIVVDPAGEPAKYPELAAKLLSQGVKHVVGCYTSSSRKEVIPHFEKHDALLWYPSHYEGFESSDNVVYTGAAPNQHIIPLIEYLLAHVGRRAYCVGSNYIWAWENNRILRESLTAAGGSVVAERYLAVGETDHQKVVRSIVEARPDFVFNTLIGTSAYTFFRDLRAACTARGLAQARDIPIASCSLSEPELAEIGPHAMDGHLSSSVYFSGIDSATNRSFVQTYNQLFPGGPRASADAESAYIAVQLLAASIASAQTDNVETVRAAVIGQRLEAPQGPVWIDAHTNHTFLTPRIGRSNPSGEFDVLYAARQPVQPDPYLVQTTPRFASGLQQGRLKVVR